MDTNWGCPARVWFGFGGQRSLAHQRDCHDYPVVSIDRSALLAARQTLAAIAATVEQQDLLMRVHPAPVALLQSFGAFTRICFAS